MSFLHHAAQAHRSEHFLPSIFTVLPASLTVSLSPRSMCSCMCSSGQQVSNGFMEGRVHSCRSYCRHRPLFSPGRGWSEGSGPPPRHVEEQAGSLGLVATARHCHGRPLEWIVALQRGHERRLWSHLHQHRNKDIVWSSCGQGEGKRHTFKGNPRRPHKISVRLQGHFEREYYGTRIDRGWRSTYLNVRISSVVSN